MRLILTLLLSLLLIATPAAAQVRADAVGATVTLDTLNETASVALAGTQGAEVCFASGTLSGSSAVPEISLDNGSTWSAAVYLDPASGAIATTLSNPSALCRAIGFLGPVTHARVRLDTFTAGAVAATLRATATRPFVVTYGSDGTNIRPVKTDTTGAVQVDVETLPSVTIGTFPDNEPFNVAQFGGSAVVTGTGASGLGIPRVTVANDSTVTANAGTNLNTSALVLDATMTGRLPAGASPADNESNTNTNLSRIGTFGFVFDGTTWDRMPGNSVDGVLVNLGVNNDVTIQANASVNVNQVAGSAVSTAATGVQKVGIVGNAGAAVDAADAAAPPANRVAVAGLTSGATGGLLKSQTVCDSFVNVNVATATTTLLVTGVAGRHVRICGISLVTAGANNVALVSGTGATCATGTTGMTGGTTAATGYNFAANGGLAQGTGVGQINQTNATGDSVCVITSAAVQLSGRISYAIW